MNDERNLLSRWSQRKAAVRRGEAPPEPADEAQPPESALPASQDAQAADQVASTDPNQNVSTEGAPADDDMPALPPIDELNFESDYTVFLNSNVPEALRRAALRKLWTSDPVLACLDGLNDYDEDFNLVDRAITLAQSGYQPGLGYMDETEKKLAQIDEALGGGDGVTDSPDASAQSKSDAEGEALSDSDATPPEPADALRQSADRVGEDVEAGSSKESDK